MPTLQVKPGPCSAGPVTIVPQQPALGAEVVGVDLGAPIDEDTYRTLRALLLRYKVIFFRDQEISREAHVALGRCFGDLEVHPIGSVEGYPEIMPVIAEQGLASAWHIDTSWRVAPSLGSILRAVTVPPVGGDTLWADAAAAYRGLPGEIRAQIDGRYAVHDLDQLAVMFDPAQPEQKAALDRLRAARRAHPLVAHPIVRRHPETGEATLYVNPELTTQIIGIDKARSDQLLAIMFAQFSRPEHQVRFKWQPHSIAIWDNRATVHRVVPDFQGPRVLERVTVAGDMPSAYA